MEHSQIKQTGQNSDLTRLFDFYVKSSPNPSFNEQCFRRSRRLNGCVSSDEEALPEENRAAEVPAPSNILSHEDRRLTETATPVRGQFSGGKP